MTSFQTMDAYVRERIRAWPQTPPGLEQADARGRGVWLKARPGPALENDAPSLKIPGASRMRTFPDGLWLWFGGNQADPYVDIFAIEVCGSLQNLLDKRSRYTPSLHSLLVSCPGIWLRRPVSDQDATPRWQRIGLFDTVPETAMALPVRDMRVLYALKTKHFREFAACNIAHAHELFAPVDILVDETGWQTPALRQFLFHAARRANFWDSTAYGDEEAWQPQAAAEPRPIRNAPPHAKPDQFVKRLGRIERPGSFAHADRMSRPEIRLAERGLKRDRSSNRGGLHLAAEYI